MHSRSQHKSILYACTDIELICRKVVKQVVSDAHPLYFGFLLPNSKGKNVSGSADSS